MIKCYAFYGLAHKKWKVSVYGLTTLAKVIIRGRSNDLVAGGGTILSGRFK